MLGSPRSRRRCGALALAALPLLAAAGCASDDRAGEDPSATSPRPAGADAPAGSGAGSDPSQPAPDGAAEPGSPPPALARVSSLAGGDPHEVACIESGIAAAAPGPELAEQPEAHAGIAGLTVVECLPPAKAAAALTERLRSPVLALDLDDTQLNCARAALAGSAGTPGYTVLVGGLAMEDPAAVREGAAELDAACGTDLTSPPAE